MPKSKLGRLPTDEDKSMFEAWSVQDMLSLGYLYLLLVGIAADSIFYSFLKINILSYSDVVDILLSPVIQIIEAPILLVIFIGLPALMQILILSLRWQHIKKREKSEYREKHDIEKLDRQLARKNVNTGWIVYAGLAIFAGFIGFGFGGGDKLNQRIENGEVKMNRSVYFTDGSKENVYLIGHNGEYLFYVKEGEKSARVVPIEANVKAITKMLESSEGEDEEKEAASK